MKSTKNAASIRPNAPQAARGKGPAAKTKASAKAAPPQKAASSKKRGLPLVEIAVFVLLLKIGAGAYYVLKTPGEEKALAPEAQAAVVSSLKNLPGELLSMLGLNSGADVAAAPQTTMEDYLAAAAEALSPAAAQALPLPPASAVSQNAIAAGAFMVIGSQAAANDVARSGTPSIPLPPGSDDLLIPAAQLPPPPLPTLARPESADGGQGQASAGLSGENVPSPAGLRSREQELAQKEALLASREEALNTLERELNRRLETMETNRSEIQSMTQRNEDILAEQKALREQQQKDDQVQRDARIEHLVIAYRGMKPEQAGMLINSMPTSFPKKPPA